MPLIPMIKKFKTLYFLPKIHGFDSLEGFLWRKGLPCTLSLLLHAMQISLAKTT